MAMVLLCTTGNINYNTQFILIILLFSFYFCYHLFFGLCRPHVIVVLFCCIVLLCNSVLTNLFYCLLLNHFIIFIMILKGCDWDMQRRYKQRHDPPRFWRAVFRRNYRYVTANISFSFILFFMLLRYLYFLFFSLFHLFQYPLIMTMLIIIN